MSKKIRTKSKGIRHSDIPYKDRLMVNKYASIAAHRDNAALIAMKIATVPRMITGRSYPPVHWKEKNKNESDTL